MKIITKRTKNYLTIIEVISDELFKNETDLINEIKLNNKLGDILEDNIIIAGCPENINKETAIELFTTINNKTEFIPFNWLSDTFCPIQIGLSDYNNVFWSVIKALNNPKYVIGYTQKIENHSFQRDLYLNGNNFNNKHIMYL